MSEFDAALSKVLLREVPAVTALKSVERLSGGASQETYRIEVDTEQGPKVLAMRRAPGGEKVEKTATHPGLDIEAKLAIILTEEISACCKVY